MTTTVTVDHVHGNDQWNRQLTISDTAHKRARTNFNPSGNTQVSLLKALTAALYTELENIMRNGDDTAKREAATAMTQLQSGAMFAVSAATAHLA